MIPKTIEERKLWKQGYRYVACVDEVGRGPLAGPVVAAAVVILPKSDLGRTKSDLGSLGNIRDSKKLSPKRREEIYNEIKKHLFESEDSSESERPSIQWGIGKVFPRTIDRINIFQATKLAMKQALMNLRHKLQKNHHIKKSCYSKKRLYIDYLILDGNMKLDVPIPQISIIKGDEKVFSCALASIVAKVTRDRIMLRYHKQYPQYGFDRHKGYGTKLHFEMLKKHGPCQIHRKSFAPVSVLKSEIRISKFETNPKFKSSKF